MVSTFKVSRVSSASSSRPPLPPACRRRSCRRLAIALADLAFHPLHDGAAAPGHATVADAHGGRELAGADQRVKRGIAHAYHRQHFGPAHEAVGFGTHETS